MPPAISVIIVSWNAKNYLRECLEALYTRTTTQDFDVWVLDNDSSDGSPDMVATEFPQVRLVRTGENLGFAKANNLGIRQSEGRYLALVNSDAIVHQNCLDQLLAFMEQRPDIGLCGPRIVHADGSLQHSCMLAPTPKTLFIRALALDTIFPQSARLGSDLMRFWPHDAEKKVDALVGCFWFARREAVDQVGLLDEDFWFYAEDVDWCKRFRDHGWPVVFTPVATTTHYGGGSTANAPVRYYVQMKRSELRYWSKHYGWLGRGYAWAMFLLYDLVRLTRAGLGWLLSKTQRAEHAHKCQRSLAALAWLLTPWAK